MGECISAVLKATQFVVICCGSPRKLRQCPQETPADVAMVVTTHGENAFEELCSVPIWLRNHRPLPPAYIRIRLNFLAWVTKLSDLETVAINQLSRDVVYKGL